MPSKYGFNSEGLFGVCRAEFDDLSSAPVLPDANHITIYAKNGNVFRVNSLGEEVNLEDTGAGAYGTEFEYFSEEGQSNTTSNGWVTRLDETTSSLPAGDYLISWSAELANSDKEKDIGLRVRRDSTTIGESRNGVSVDERYEMRAGFEEFTHGGGTVRLRMDFGQTDEGGTGRIRRARISILRVA